MEESKENTETLYPRRVFAVSDFEISNDVLKFFSVKGLIKKKVVLVREIPIFEISNVESYWNELSITWQGVTNIFFKKNSFEPFGDLRDKILGMIEEHKKDLAKDQVLGQRKADYLLVINGTFSVVDILFDVLMFLHEKRVNWQPISDRCASLGQGLNLTPQLLPPVTLDFSKLSFAIKTESLREVTAEAFSILKSIYGYYNNLSEGETVDDFRPNVEDLKSLLNSYFMLNDFFLGKVVGDKDNPREIHSFERLLQKLAEKTNFKVDREKLRLLVDGFGVEGGAEGAVEEARELFMDQISLL